MDLFVVDSWEDLDAALDAGDVQITDAIFGKIKKGVKRNFKRVKIFSVTLTDEPEYSYDWYLERKEFPKALMNCLEVYEDHERYEDCAEIMGLLKQL